jgi:hypothetical protein
MVARSAHGGRARGILVPIDRQVLSLLHRILARVLPEDANDVDAHLIRAGQVILADKGFAGREFEALVAGYGARLVRPDRRDEPTRHGNLGGVRQWIESVNDTLKGQLSLEEHGGRTLTGCSSASPSACSPWPPPSGTTGPPTYPASAP